MKYFPIETTTVYVVNKEKFPTQKSAKKYQDKLNRRIDIVNNYDIKLVKIKDWSTKFSINQHIILWLSDWDGGSEYCLFETDSNGKYKLTHLMSSYDQYELQVYKNCGQTYKELTKDLIKHLVHRCDLEKLIDSLKEVLSEREIQR